MVIILLHSIVLNGLVLLFDYFSNRSITDTYNFAKEISSRQMFHNKIMVAPLEYFLNMDYNTCFQGQTPQKIKKKLPTFLMPHSLIFISILTSLSIVD